MKRRVRGGQPWGSYRQPFAVWQRAHHVPNLPRCARGSGWHPPHFRRTRLERHRRMTAVARDREVLALELEPRRQRVTEPVLARREVAPVACRPECAMMRVIGGVASHTASWRAAEPLVGAVARAARGGRVITLEQPHALVIERERLPRARDMARRALRSERAAMRDILVARTAALHRETIERGLPLCVARGVARDARDRLVPLHERKRRARPVHEEFGRRARRIVLDEAVTVQALLRRVLAARMSRVGVHARVRVALLAAGLQALEPVGPDRPVTRAARERRVLAGERRLRLRVIEARHIGPLRSGVARAAAALHLREARAVRCGLGVARLALHAGLRVAGVAPLARHAVALRERERRPLVVVEVELLERSERRCVAAVARERREPRGHVRRRRVTARALELRERELVRGVALHARRVAMGAGERQLRVAIVIEFEVTFHRLPGRRHVAAFAAQQLGADEPVWILLVTARRAARRRQPGIARRPRGRDRGVALPARGLRVRTVELPHDAVIERSDRAPVADVMARSAVLGMAGSARLGLHGGRCMQSALHECVTCRALAVRHRARRAGVTRRARDAVVALRQRARRLRERHRRCEQHHDHPPHSMTLANRDRDCSCVFSAHARGVQNRYARRMKPMTLVIFGSLTSIIASLRVTPVCETQRLPIAKTLSFTR
jgi:hypothetical protein